MITEKIVEGLKVTVCNKSLKNDCPVYVIFQNKIWRKTGSEGSGIHYAMKLERGSVIKWIHNEEFKQVEYVLKPTGYINLERLTEVTEKFDFSRMTLTIKKGYVVTRERNQETVESEITELLSSFERQAREKGLMFSISSFRMINEE
jgi:hypothetical protein